MFHAGTKKSGDDVAVTAGGRVLAVSAHAPTLREALDAAYKGVDSITFEGKTFRGDIAHRYCESILKHQRDRSRYCRALSSSPTKQESLTYAQAGVSVDAGNALVEAIKPFVKSTKRPGADAELGGFGGLFDIKATGYQDPVLVSGTDGVGTKLRLAVDTGIHDFVGIDLVAMSVNDLLVQGAEPLYFLDYYACSKLDVGVAAKVIKGIAEGCKQANCALIGGETAEMPGMYQEGIHFLLLYLYILHDKNPQLGDYDLAGFAVGAVERNMILPSSDIIVGDVLLGVSSSGVHSNGFSLVRKIVAKAGLTFAAPCPWNPAISLGRALLEPTQIYVSQVLPLAKSGLLKGMSHITGGGFIENVPRVLPSGLGCYIDAATWDLPPVFRWLLKTGNVEPLEMARIFNNGIGLVLIVDVSKVDEVLLALKSTVAYPIGEVTTKPGVEMRNVLTWTT